MSFRFTGYLLTIAHVELPASRRLVPARGTNEKYFSPKEEAASGAIQIAYVYLSVNIYIYIDVSVYICTSMHACMHAYIRVYI